MGSLKIHERGTSGQIEATLPVESEFGPAQHEEVTECDHDPDSPHYQHGPFHYPETACVSKARLSQFTAKNVRLNFLCRADSTALPPGVAIDYSTYLGQSQASGFLQLKRTHQR